MEPTDQAAPNGGGAFEEEDFFQSYPNPSMGGGSGMGGGAGGATSEDPFNAFFGDDQGSDAAAPQDGSRPAASSADGASSSNYAAANDAPEIMYMPPPQVETPIPEETMKPDAYGAGGSEPIPTYGGFTDPEPLRQYAAHDDDDDNQPPSRPETPRAIREWRASFAQRLEAKKAKEDQIRTQNLAESKACIERMHAAWEERCTANKQLNVEEEKRFVAERDALQAQFSAPGEKPNWNMIPQLANLSGEFKKGQRDTSRMRSVILKLKT
eukprot:CAMPEP_0184693078 /NCGR_PEP_ID=MMETSP0313-20130426/1377_1 /TAXON_ID=2792 /ORGANISM="Porphyridium aerugineum, Strain SAG 1380-2" /LENGTH=267 /DNA_ID=CAMNT_0027151041 /DNA_START=89 /DNA_END=892 /DNA_ORIENTATION=+